MKKKKDKKVEVTMREFLRNPGKMGGMVRDGTAIEVTKNGAPFFTAVPAFEKKGITGKDIVRLIKPKKSGLHSPNISTRVDEMLYGK
ncbi:hypothetical protein KTR10_01575 [Candidatus Kaiserbacteria bacterium]|nr:hypothetical protein [Candidatus Kaiserbacteria bacterium]